MKRIKLLQILIPTIVGMLLVVSCGPIDIPIQDPRELYSGEWWCEESSVLYPDEITYDVTIEADTSEAGTVWISNFYHLGYAEVDKIKASVTTSTITIDPQFVCEQTFYGSGTLDGSKITWHYYVEDGADKDEVNASYTLK